MLYSWVYVIAPEIKFGWLAAATISNCKKLGISCIASEKLAFFCCDLGLFSLGYGFIIWQSSLMVTPLNKLFRPLRAMFILSRCSFLS